MTLKSFIFLSFDIESDNKRANIGMNLKIYNKIIVTAKAVFLYFSFSFISYDIYYIMHVGDKKKAAVNSISS